MSQGTRRKDAVELAAGYTAKHRFYEKLGILAGVVLFAALCVRLALTPPLSGWFVPLAALCGMLAADLVSGLVHWAFDTWGAVDTPVLGRLAIRTFREHHVDQKAITRHDFVETNGHNIALSCVMSTLGLLFLMGTPGLLATFGAMWALCTGMFVASTSQIHKWAHMDTPPRFIHLLQRARLLICAEHHAKHHAPPYDRNYCITVGWMNEPLRYVRFFETLEAIITWATGWVPREDDIGKEAALATMAEAEPKPPPVTVPKES